jgi:hypothetical protein
VWLDGGAPRVRGWKRPATALGRGEPGLPRTGDAGEDWVYAGGWGYPVSRKRLYNQGFAHQDAAKPPTSPHRIAERAAVSVPHDPND